MNTRIKRRGTFSPSITEAKLEERIVLSSATTFTPPHVLAPHIIGSNFNNGFVSETGSVSVGLGSPMTALNTNLGTGVSNTAPPVATHHLYLGMLDNAGGVQFILE